MRLLFAAWLALATALASAEVPVPPLKERVTDLTGTLSAQQKSELESRIAGWEAKRGSQLAVLMLPTTKPEEIEQYAIRVAEAWKIGRKGVDDGLLLVVAKDDRRLRVEVGYGLEGAIPDSVAKRVIDEKITPRFREGDFHGGIRDGVEQLIRLAEGEKLPEREVTAGGGRSVFDLAGDYLMFAVIFIVIAGGALKAMLGRAPGSLATGATLGLIAWLLLGLTIGATAAVIGFVLTFANTGIGRGGRWSSGGGSWGGGSSSSSSSSSSSGWSGGGGGSFGGGGASGRW